MVSIMDFLIIIGLGAIILGLLNELFLILNDSMLLYCVINIDFIV